MLHMPVRPLDSDNLWQGGEIAVAQKMDTNARIGRRTWSLLREAGLEDIRVHYMIIDSLRVPRDTFAAIMEAWRDGYVDALASPCKLTPQDIRALFDQQIADIRDAGKYSVWHVPAVSGRRKGVSKFRRGASCAATVLPRRTLHVHFFP